MVSRDRDLCEKLRADNRQTVCLDLGNAIDYVPLPPVVPPTAVTCGMEEG